MARAWTADDLLEMIRAFQPACVLIAAAELDLFSVLDEQPATSATLAARLNADGRATAILLDALVALDLLDKHDGTYSIPSSLAALLTEGSSTSILPAVRHQGNCLRRWGRLARVVRTGDPAECTPSIRGSAADCEAFIGAMNNFTEPVAPEVIDRLQPLRFERLLDIGGASGTWTVAFLLAVPEATAVLFDLPEVIPLARERLARAGLADRVTLVAGDYNVEPLPGGADFAWLSAIAHQNSPQQNRSLYAKIHAALSPGGTLVIRDVVMDVDRTHPGGGAMFAVNMLVATEGGNSYAFDEFRTDLEAAGFIDVDLVCRDDHMNSLIRATKPQH
jgi:precorrin-6B methylase 2